jgi:hypothetical protein
MAATVSCDVWRRSHLFVHPAPAPRSGINKVTLSVQVNMKADLREIYGAPTRAAAEAAIDVFAHKYGAKYDKAVACLTKDREALLANRENERSPVGEDCQADGVQTCQCRRENVATIEG